jgi:ABC-type transport system substrate-binding protein
LGAGFGPAAAQSKPRVLRYAFQVAETGFDPAQISDTYSRTVTAHLFEALYAFDHLARPAKLLPLTAEDHPVVENDYRRWTVKIRPGTYFVDDPAFKGEKRELVAADVVYSFKRFADPAVKSPFWASIDDLKFLGLADLRQQALNLEAPLDWRLRLQASLPAPLATWLAEGEGQLHGRRLQLGGLLLRQGAASAPTLPRDS